MPRLNEGPVQTTPTFFFEMKIYKTTPFPAGRTPTAESQIQFPEDRVTFAFDSALCTSPVACCVQVYDTNGLLLLGVNEGRVEFDSNEDGVKTITFSGFDSLPVDENGLKSCAFVLWLESIERTDSAGRVRRTSPGEEVKWSVYV